MLLAPEEKVTGLSGMDLLQTAMEHHLGRFGVIFIAATLFLFSFSTFLGILFYARCNVAYLFGDNWASQTAYKVLALVMLFIGGLAAYTFVWDLGDVGIGLMTVSYTHLTSFSSKKRTPRAFNIPMPPSLVALPPIPMIKLRQPFWRAWFIISPTP